MESEVSSMPNSDRFLSLAESQWEEIQLAYKTNSQKYSSIVTQERKVTIWEPLIKQSKNSCQTKSEQMSFSFLPGSELFLQSPPFHQDSRGTSGQKGPGLMQAPNWPMTWLSTFDFYLFCLSLPYTIQIITNYFLLPFYFEFPYVFILRIVPSIWNFPSIA